jgi:hypothetical protein
MSIDCQLRAGKLVRARQPPAGAGCVYVRWGVWHGHNLAHRRHAADLPHRTPKGRRTPGTRSRSPSAPSVVQKGSGLNLPPTCANRYDHHEEALMAGPPAAPPARCSQPQAALANSPQDRSTGHEGLLMIGANRAACRLPPAAPRVRPNRIICAGSFAWPNRVPAARNRRYAQPAISESLGRRNAAL